MMINVFVTYNSRRRALLFFMLQFITLFNVISLLCYVFLNLKTVVTMINNMQGQLLVMLCYFGRPGLKSVAALPINI